MAGHEAHMVNGTFQGSNTPNFAKATSLFVIKSAPKAGVWTTVSPTVNQAFRYIRFLVADGTSQDIATATLVGM